MQLVLLLGRDNAATVRLAPRTPNAENRRRETNDDGYRRWSGDTERRDGDGERRGGRGGGGRRNERRGRGRGRADGNRRGDITNNSDISGNSVSGKIIPGSEKIIPGSEKIIPGSEKIIPGSEKIIPGSEKIIPRSEKANPRRKDSVKSKVSPSNKKENPPPNPELPEEELPTPNPILPEEELELPIQTEPLANNDIPGDIVTEDLFLDPTPPPPPDLNSVPANGVLSASEEATASNKIYHSENKPKKKGNTKKEAELERKEIPEVEEKEPEKKKPEHVEVKELPKIDVKENIPNISKPHTIQLTTPLGSEITSGEQTFLEIDGVLYLKLSPPMESPPEWYTTLRKNFDRAKIPLTEAQRRKMELREKKLVKPTEMANGSFVYVVDVPEFLQGKEKEPEKKKKGKKKQKKENEEK